MTRDLVDKMGGGRGSMPREMDDDRATRSAKHHEVNVALHYETKDAVLVSESGEEAKALWLPKSQVEIHRDGKQTDAVRKNTGEVVKVALVCVVVPEWLAKDKGLI